jgi:hypothetical protein
MSVVGLPPGTAIPWHRSMAHATGMCHTTNKASMIKIAAWIFQIVPPQWRPRASAPLAWAGRSRRSFAAGWE